VQKNEESARHYSFFGCGREGRGVTWALQLKAREAGDFGMSISVSHAPSAYALEIYAEQSRRGGCVTSRLVYRTCSVPL